MAMKTPQKDSPWSFASEDHSRILWAENLLKGIILLTMVCLTGSLIICLVYRFWPQVQILAQALGHS